MTRRRSHHGPATQPTCRPRPSSTTSGPKAGPLEISHACRLRRKLSDAGDGRFVENVWGVGYRLISPGQRRAEAGAA